VTLSKEKKREKVVPSTTQKTPFFLFVDENELEKIKLKF